MVNLGGDRGVAATIFSEDGKFSHAVERRCPVSHGRMGTARHQVQHPRRGQSVGIG